MKTSLRTKLEQLESRIAELNALLASEDATRDLDRYRSLTKEHSDIGSVVERFRDYRGAEADLATAEVMAHDPEMREFAEEERAAALQRIESLGAELQAMLLPRDPDDERNVFVEVRAGTGGD